MLRAHIARLRGHLWVGYELLAVSRDGRRQHLRLLGAGGNRQEMHERQAKLCAHFYKGRGTGPWFERLMGSALLALRAFPAAPSAKVAASRLVVICSQPLGSKSSHCCWQLLCVDQVTPIGGGRAAGAPGADTPARALRFLNKARLRFGACRTSALPPRRAAPRGMWPGMLRAGAGGPRCDHSASIMMIARGAGGRLRAWGVHGRLSPFTRTPPIPPASTVGATRASCTLSSSAALLQEDNVSQPYTLGPRPSHAAPS